MGKFSFTLAVLTAFAVALGGCIHHFAKRKSLHRRTVAQQLDSAVAIFVSCESGRFGFGSGVIVGPNKVMTAAHVVKCPGRYLVMVDGLESETIYEGKKAYSDSRTDLALLETVERLPYTPVSIHTVSPGKRVCTVPMAPRADRRCGESSLRSRLPGNLRHDIITEPGNSGSGVYDMGGHLVGIVTHYTTCKNGQLCGGAMTTLSGRKINGYLP